MNAAAFVVGPREGAGAMLFDLAQALDFLSILPFRSVLEAERVADHIPLCFFLFAEVQDVRKLVAPARAIRFAGGRRVRFSPLVYFSRNPSIETIKACISMGFDDVITEPFRASRVAPRLMRQVDTELVYYETSSYFGPDRRRRLDDAEREKHPRRDRQRGVAAAGRAGGRGPHRQQHGRAVACPSAVAKASSAASKSSGTHRPASMC